MKRTMNAIEVGTDANGNVEVKETWNDANFPDPVVTITKEQAGLVASWILDAASESTNLGAVNEDNEKISVGHYTGGPSVDSEEVQIFTNGRGMVVLKINDDSFMEISPIMAKRMREQLTQAITISLADMLRGDEEI